MSGYLIKFGRPNFAKIFDKTLADIKRDTTRHAEEEQLDNASDQSVGVFFCGPQMIADELSSLCHKKSTIRQTTFKLYQEHF